MHQKRELLVIESFARIRRKGTNFELCVKRRGFPESESDWTNLTTLQQDLPAMEIEYSAELKRASTPREREFPASI